MKRVLSAAVLLPLVLIVFILGNTYVVDVFMGIVALRCIYELFHAFEQKGHHPVRWVGYLAAIAIMFIHVIPEHYAKYAVISIIPISVLIFFYMIASLINNCSYVVICQGIKNRFAFSAVFYQFVLLQNTKLMRNCGLSHIQYFSKIAYTYFSFK